MTSGRTKTITGTNPAANTEFSDTVPAGTWWEVLAVSVSCAQGATQTPQPTLVIDDGTTDIFRGLGASSAQDSAVTTQYNWGPSNTLTAGAAATTVSAPMPQGLILGPGYRIRSVTAGKGANTDYASPAYVVTEYSGDPRV